MKIVKFAENLVPLILSGQKTSTWRLFDDKDLTIGDELSLCHQKTGEELAVAQIVSMKDKPLGQVDDSDFDRHERFESKEKMLETYRSYYGNAVTEDTMVKMIGFKLLHSR